MKLLLNIVLAALAFLVVRYLLARLGLDETIGWLVAVVVAVVVFLQDYASNLLNQYHR